MMVFISPRKDFIRGAVISKESDINVSLNSTLEWISTMFW